VTCQLAQSAPTALTKGEGNHSAAYVQRIRPATHNTKRQESKVAWHLVRGPVLCTAPNTQWNGEVSERSPLRVAPVY
jgi:hypothetical protein